MQRFTVLTAKLSRAERLLLGVVGLLVIANLYLGWVGLQVDRDLQRLSEEAVSARRSLAVAQEDTGITALEQEKLNLEEKVASALPQPFEDGKVTLALWQQAAESGVVLEGMTEESSSTLIEDNQLTAFHYSLEARGSPQDLHRFISLATSLDYAPLVDTLLLKPIIGESGQWQLTLKLIVLAHPEKQPEKAAKEDGKQP